MSGKRKFIVGICAEILTVALIWGALFAIQRLMQPYGVDYGYATLRYGYAEVVSAGTDWSFSDLLAWQGHTYMTRDGHIFYAWLLAALLKNGAMAFFAFNSIVIAALLWCMSLLVGKTSFKRVIAMFSFLALFFCISTVTVQSLGAYWASASVLYLWPMVPFVAAVFLLSKLASLENPKQFYACGVGLALTALLTALGNEMFGILLILIVLFHAVYYRKSFGKKIWIFLMIAAGLALVGSLVLLFAPGSLANKKAADGTGFLGTIIAIYRTIYFGTTTQSIGNITFGVLITLVSMYNLLMFGIKRKRLRYRVLFVAWCIALPIATMIVPNHSQVVGFLLVGFVVATQMASFVLRYLQTGKIHFIPLLLAIYISAFARALTLRFTASDVLPFMILIGPFIVDAFMEVGTISFSIPVRWKRYACRGVVAFLVGTTVLVGAVNYRESYNGYNENRLLWELNEKSIAYAIRNNAKEVRLLRLKEGYAGIMPYDGDEEGEIYLRDYYGIPAEMKITWLVSSGDLPNKDSYVAGKTLAESQKIEGFLQQNAEGIWAAGNSFAYVAATGAYYDLVIANPLNEDNDVGIYRDGIFEAYCTIPAQCAITYTIDLRYIEQNVHFNFVMEKVTDSILSGLTVGAFTWQADTAITEYNVDVAEKAAKEKPARLDFVGYGLVEMGTYLFIPDYRMVGEGLASQYGLTGTPVSVMPATYGYFNKDQYSAGDTLLTAALVHGAYPHQGSDEIWTSNHLAFVVGKGARYAALLYNPWDFNIGFRAYRNGRLVYDINVPATKMEAMIIDTTTEKGNTHYFFSYSAYRPGGTGGSSDMRNLGLLISEGGI